MYLKILDEFQASLMGNPHSVFPFIKIKNAKQDGQYLLISL
jgi:hypothetical protein